LLFTYRYEKANNNNNNIDIKPVDENRELKTSSNLQLTSGNIVNSEISLRESYHHGVAVPMSVEEYEKELAREKDLINKAKKKIAMESSTPKDGISTWILLSGSNNPTTSRPEVNNKPSSYRIDNEKKPVKNNVSPSSTTKKRIPTTAVPKTTKPTQKYNNNKLLTRVKVTSTVEAKNETEVQVSTTTTKAPPIKKIQTTTKAKKFTTTKPKVATTTTAKVTTTTTTTPKSTTVRLFFYYN
jgi:hypothetical protein